MKTSRRIQVHPAASIVICIFICKASLDVLRDALDKMVDKACDEETAQAIRRTALAPPGVVRIDGLKTRLFGPRMYVDIEIAVEDVYKRQACNCQSAGCWAWQYKQRPPPGPPQGLHRNHTHAGCHTFLQILPPFPRILSRRLSAALPLPSSLPYLQILQRLFRLP